MSKRFCLAGKITAFGLCALAAELAIAGTAYAVGAEPWTGAHSTGPFAGGEIRQAYCDIVSLVEGNLGALLATAAAVMAVASAAFGNIRQGAILGATAIGAATISAGVSLGFGDLCGADGNAIMDNSSSRTISAEINDVATKSSTFSAADIAAIARNMNNPMPTSPDDSATTLPSSEQADPAEDGENDPFAGF